MSNFSSNFHILKSIGHIHTPYKKKAPYQSVDVAKGSFKLILDEKYEKGLKELEKFTYIYIIYYLDKVQRSNQLTLSPPWANNSEIGVFASRSPDRPNPIGISVVKLIKIEKNHIYISGIDAFDGTSIIDIKPYIKDLDSKKDANYGWLDGEENQDHINLHIKGIPHKH